MFLSSPIDVSSKLIVDARTSQRVQQYSGVERDGYTHIRAERHSRTDIYSTIHSHSDSASNRYSRHDCNRCIRCQASCG